MGQISELHKKILAFTLDLRTSRSYGAPGLEVLEIKRVREAKSVRLGRAAAHFRHTLAALNGKANFNPNQPRVPAGSSDGGQWTDAGGSTGGSLQTGRSSARRPPSGIRVQIVARPRDTGSTHGIGHNGGPPLEDPSELPPEPPASRKTRLVIAKKVGTWVARRVLSGVPAVRSALLAIEAARWLYSERHNILSFAEGPRALSELQQAVSERRRGYEVHHIVEQTPAIREGYAPTLVHGRENLVRIPTWKHHQINAWYSTPQRRFGDQTPREYLRGKEWKTRMAIGYEALIEFGVLKP